MKAKNEKDHYAKKDMGAAEFFKKQRKERNLVRAKQRWISEETVNGLVVPGHWTREQA